MCECMRVCVLRECVQRLLGMTAGKAATRLDLKPFSGWEQIRADKASEVFIVCHIISASVPLLSVL